MRNLLLGTTMFAATAALTGCSFIAPGASKDYRNYDRASQGHHVKQAPRACGTQNCLARWNLEGGIGRAFIVGGDVVTGDRTNAGSGAAIRNISWDSAYDDGYRAELGGSYALTPNRKVTATGFYENAEGNRNLDWGTVGGEQLTGGLSDYESYGGELGLRQYFAPKRAPIVRSVRPYVEGRLGAARVESIDVVGTQLGGDVFSAAPVPFYDGSWVGTAAGLVGLETPLTRYSTIGVETGIRYKGELESDTSALSAGTPLAGINNADGRFSVPLMLRGRYRF